MRSFLKTWASTFSADLSMASIVLLNFQGESSCREATLHFFLYRLPPNCFELCASSSATSPREYPNLIPVVSL
jgi:hypothetical protein